MRVSNKCKKWIPAFGVILLMIQTGLILGWPSPNLIKLMAANSTISITASEASWIVSLTRLGQFPGAIIALISIAFIGSKKTILVALTVTSASWMCLIKADSADWLYASRFLSGITQSMISCSFPLYLGEVTPSKIRGAFICLSMLGTPSGAFLCNLAESYLPMKISSSLYLVICWVSFLIFLYLPDSPYYLVKIGNYERAKKAINWYYFGGNVEKEFNDIKIFVKTNSGQSVKEQLYEFNSPYTKKAMTVTLTLYILSDLSGMVNLVAYMEPILMRAKFNAVSPKVFNIINSFNAIFTVGLTIMLIEKCGRRFLMMISSIGTTLGMAGLAAHFFLLNADVDPEVIQFLPFISIFSYTIAYVLGYGCVPHAVLGELFSAKTKIVAAFFVILINSIIGFLFTKSYQPMIEHMGEVSVYGIYAGFSIMAIPCVLFLMPETKGKTLLEIQNSFFIVKNKDIDQKESNIPHLNKRNATTKL